MAVPVEGARCPNCGLREGIPCPFKEGLWKQECCPLDNSHSIDHGLWEAWAQYAGL